MNVSEAHKVVRDAMCATEVWERAHIHRLLEAAALLSATLKAKDRDETEQEQYDCPGSSLKMSRPTRDAERQSTADDKFIEIRAICDRTGCQTSDMVRALRDIEAIVGTDVERRGP